MIRLLCAFWLVCCGVAWGHLPQASHTAYYHEDGAGNVTALMDAQEGIAARYLYSPFGRLTGQWGPMSAANRYRFSSKEVHATSGLSYYGFRFYDAGLQRWLNPDPLGEAGGINLYGFVRNDPLSFVDPYGEDFHVVGASGMQMPGPLGFLTGDTALETVAAGAYNLLPQTGNMVANVGRGAVEAVAGLLGFADFASEQTGATRVLGRSPSQALEAINPTLLSELQLLKWPKTAKPCAAKTATELTGEIHHGISKTVHRALEQHPNLKDLYKARDPRFVTQAKDASSHRGWPTWHRELDAEVSGWVRSNPNATPQQFKNYLRQRYSQPDLQNRFPNGL